eukprot:TRINITY_DN2759_c0_g1_i1.p1 TRINITY_DN2759_c0_g1~~TRINITY_DN2759_c0_g1_i1.p1  ORF type:complete len:271 (-),score=77.70 TRINITY_DN2759_c0_g1_i1:57-869(-)
MESVNDLLTSASNGSIQQVGYFLDKYPQWIDEKGSLGQTPLMCAVTPGHMSIVRLLLGRGANVNEKDRFKRTALIHAAEHDHLEICELLIQNGSDAYERDYEGRTALDMIQPYLKKKLRSMALRQRSLSTNDNSQRPSSQSIPQMSSDQNDSVSSSITATDVYPEVQYSYPQTQTQMQTQTHYGQPASVYDDSDSFDTSYHNLNNRGARTSDVLIDRIRQNVSISDINTRTHPLNEVQAELDLLRSTLIKVVKEIDYMEGRQVRQQTQYY